VRENRSGEKRYPNSCPIFRLGIELNRIYRVTWVKDPRGNDAEPVKNRVFGGGLVDLLEIWIGLHSLA
jgi:hypothetical protein